jgi:predicted Fe-Mo cluster-binding NifX family protein
MKVAIPISDGRVSPVTDTACRVLVAEVAGGRELSRRTVDIPQAGMPHRANFLAGLGIDVLICGAISRAFEQLLAASGVKARPWYRGDVDEILAAHASGTLQSEAFLLPGRRQRRRGSGMGRHRAGRMGLNRSRRFKEEQ